MKQQLITFFSASFALALTATAGPQPLASSKEVTPMAPEPLSWTGFYIGANGGYGFSDNLHTDIEPANAAALNFFNVPVRTGHDANGAVFGGQLGYNFQWNWLVLGVEGDFDGSGMSGTRAQNLPDLFLAGGTPDSFMTTNTINWLATVRARVGVAWGSSLFYATGGGAWEDLERQSIVNIEARGGIFGSSASSDRTSTRGGYTAGGGWEYMLAKHWTLRGEYLFYHFDGNDNDLLTFAAPFAFGPTFANAKTFSNDVHTFRLGVNFKF